jgi:hypothetical protein
MKTKSIIAALLLAASSAFAQVPSYVPTNGLVGWWPFNGNANDESGNGNNGTVNGATLTSDRLGNSNKAYIFNGISNKIEISSTNQLNFGVNPSFSISVWINKQTQVSGGVISKAVPLNGFSWKGFNLVFDDFQIGYPCLSNVVSPSINSWNNLVYTINNGSVIAYLNGVIANQFYCAQIINNSISTNENLYFGVDRDGNNYFQGQIDDIGIWNRALSQQEITALYNSQSCVGNITADGPTTFCAGNSVTLTSDVVGGTYQWRRNGINITTNGTSKTFKATSTGSYTCVATCNGTALTSNAIQVTSQTNAAVTLAASGATSFCAGDSVTLNATNLGSGYSVQWYRTNISMQGATNYSVVVKQPGTYKTVTRNLANGCSRISSGSIITAVNCRMSNPAIIAVDPVSDEIPATKLGNSTETTMHLFPNPNAGSFTLEYDGIEADFEVQVVNTMGQVIYNDIIPSNDKHLKTTINLGDNMQKGVYVVRIINGENVQESKVMLQ